MKIGLCMIVSPRDHEVPLLSRLLKSAQGAYDNLYITITGKNEKVEEVAKAYDAHISYFDWEDDFAKARNFNFSQSKDDFIIWLDSDDVIPDPKAIRGAIQEYKDLDGIYLPYNYDIDDLGNILVTHTKMRIVKNNGSHIWRGVIHEDLAPQKHVQTIKLDSPVVEHFPGERTQEWSERNIRIITKELEKNKDNPDPRLVGYLGREYYARGKDGDPESLKKAIKYLAEFVKTSGWKEDRLDALLTLGDCYLLLEDNELARHAYLKAIELRPDWPQGYLRMARMDHYDENWDNVIEWTKTGLSKKMPDGNTAYSPASLFLQPLTYLALAYVHTGKHREALKYAKQAYDLYHNDENVVFVYETVKEIAEGKDYVLNLQKMMKYLNDRKNKSLMRHLATAVPAELLSDPTVVMMKHAISGSRTWFPFEIAFFCGEGHETWSPKSEERGVGGSEEAIINLARELAKRGWRPTVYNSCHEEEGEYDGVIYKNVWHFNANDKFNVLVGWRIPQLFNRGIKANVRILDLHDVPFEEDFDEETLKNVDKIFVKSNYHRSLLPKVPDDKFVIVGNGVNLDHFTEAVPRDPHKVVYGSSQVRGLRTLVDVWPEIKKEVPEAKLTVFYGWAVYDKMHKDSPKDMAWKWRLIKDMRTQGIEQLGWISHKDVAKQFMSAKVWAYPVTFREIFCITAYKAQLGGAIPVTTDVAALEEAVQQGVKISCDEEYNKDGIINPETRKKFVAEVVKALKGETPFNSKKAGEFVSQFSWPKVTDAWEKEIRGMLESHSGSSDDESRLLEPTI